MHNYNLWESNNPSAPDGSREEDIVGLPVDTNDTSYHTPRDNEQLFL